MATTTKKAEALVTTPGNQIELGDVPSVGPVNLKELNKAGIKTFRQLMGKFMLEGRPNFHAWASGIFASSTTSTVIDGMCDALEAKLRIYERY